MVYRRYSLPSMWDDMDRLQKEINRLFDVFPGSTSMMSSGFPAMNVWTNPEGLVVSAELPGVDIGDVDIQVVGDSLTISGKRTLPAIQDATYHRQERWDGTFARSVRLPFPVEPEKVDATLHNGILEIKLPRLAASKPKKIAIRAGI